TEALRLAAQLAPGRPIEPLERLEPRPSSLVPPGARHRPVDEEGLNRVGRPGVEYERPIPLGDEPGPARMDEQGGIPNRQEADGRGRVGIRERRSREVEELLAILAAEASQAKARERRREVSDRQPGPVRDGSARRRAEAAQVAADEQV